MSNCYFLNQSHQITRDSPVSLKNYTHGFMKRIDPITIPTLNKFMYDDFESFEEDFLEEFEQAKMDAEVYGAGILVVDKDGTVERKSFGEMIDYVVNYLTATKQLNS